MPVIELASLILKPPHQIDSIHPQLARIASLQSAVSSFPLYFFESASQEKEGTGRPPIVHLLSAWESTAAHWKWIEGVTNKMLLAEMKDVFDVESLRHLVINAGMIDFIGANADTSAKLVLVILTLPEPGTDEVPPVVADVRHFVENIPGLRVIRWDQGQNEDQSSREYVLLAIAELGQNGGAIPEQLDRLSQTFGGYQMKASCSARVL